MPTYADPVTFPLGPPSVNGTNVTVDLLLNNPTRVTRVVADLVMANFYLDRIFASGGDVQGGAVLYEQGGLLDNFTNRDVERIEPGDEAPIVGGERLGIRTAQVEKFGGKFPVTDEARRRNMLSRVNNQMRRLSNTIVRKMHQRGLAELAAAIAEHGRTAVGSSWLDAMSLTSQTVSPALLPTRDLAAADREADENELGYSYDTLIVNPQEAEALRVVFGTNLDDVLGDNGVNDLISTPRKAAGSAYLLAGGQVGELRTEEPLRTVVEREGAPLLREQDWVQSMVNPVMYVTDPYAILEITGLAA